MLSTVNMDKWAVIVPVRDAPGVDNLVRTMAKVASPLNMTIRNPCEIVKLTDIKGSSYNRAMDTLVAK